MAWVWWIAGGVVLFSLVLLGLAGRALLIQLTVLARALARLQRRADAAQGLAEGALCLQQRSVELQQAVARLAARAPQRS